ncbi:hypothetical protein I4F81_001482 [Pyropia yezoensis]|uniref:Uncharacterized protein n=1 Tax=Pyropia yezoensis TaxID=2788 RepID=A0ACC3BN05_PYRYE|nr:hypothetical protein I4F81_001482 [Neopyropia yezoensis]
MPSRRCRWCLHRLVTAVAATAAAAVIAAAAVARPAAGWWSDATGCGPGGECARLLDSCTWGGGGEALELFFIFVSSVAASGHDGKRVEPPPG